MTIKVRHYRLDEPGDALLTRLKKRAARRAIPAFPRTVQIETVAACNADCVWCPYGKIHPAPPAGRMSDERFERIVEECARHRVTRLSPYLTNEPFLDPGIADKVRLVNLRIPSCKVVLTTNGALLDEAATEGILSLDGGLHALYVSFHGIAKTGYERTVRGSIRFEQVLDNVNHLLAEMRRRRLARPKVWISMVASRLVDAPRAVAYWRKRGVRAKYTALENRGGSVPEAAEVALGRMSYYTDCPRMFKQAYICWDGAMVSCCTDYARRSVLGNVFESGIEAVWNSQAANDLRRRYLCGLIHTIPLCGSCRIDQEVEVEA